MNFPFSGSQPLAFIPHCWANRAVVWMSDRSAGFESMQEILSFSLFWEGRMWPLWSFWNPAAHSLSLGVFHHPIIPYPLMTPVVSSMLSGSAAKPGQKGITDSWQRPCQRSQQLFLPLTWSREGWRRIHHVLIIKVVDRISECRVSIQICNGLIQWRVPLTCAFSMYVCCIHHSGASTKCLHLWRSWCRCALVESVWEKWLWAVQQEGNGVWQSEFNLSQKLIALSHNYYNTRKGKKIVIFRLTEVFPGCSCPQSSHCPF